MSPENTASMPSSGTTSRTSNFICGNILTCNKVFADNERRTLMDRLKGYGLTAGILIMSFLGGMAGQWLLRPMAATAAGTPTYTDRLIIMDSKGKTAGQIYTAPGSGAIISLNAANGTQRVQLGTYSAGNE